MTDVDNYSKPGWFRWFSWEERAARRETQREDAIVASADVGVVDDVAKPLSSR